MTDPTILFYRTDAPFGAFSNFSRHPFRLYGETWPTTEHLFQAEKFTSAKDRDEVRQAKTPFIAAQLGRERHRSFREDWAQVRDEVMLKALRAKFRQNEDALALLGATTGARLVEHTANDHYWADGGDGSGSNRLGQLLEQVRGELCPSHPRMFLPPWIRFPEIEDGDMFFRMGHGEDYVFAAHAWRRTLPDFVRKEFDAYYPPGKPWESRWWDPQ
jgi:ribA/ribD-fused uncharacterized protein